jgi:hypothetical protein
MQDCELYRRILGIEAPWYVDSVELKLEVGEIHVRLAHHEMIDWPCAECGTACKLYDHQPERQWRHLDWLIALMNSGRSCLPVIPSYRKRSARPYLTPGLFGVVARPWAPVATVDAVGAAGATCGECGAAAVAFVPFRPPPGGKRLLPLDRLVEPFPEPLQEHLRGADGAPMKSGPKNLMSSSATCVCPDIFFTSVGIPPHNAKDA